MNILMFATLTQDSPRERQHHVGDWFAGRPATTVTWINPTGTVNHSVLMILRKALRLLRLGRSGTEKRDSDDESRTLFFVPVHDVPLVREFNIWIVCRQLMAMARDLPNRRWDVAITYYPSDIVNGVLYWLKEHYGTRLVYENVQRLNSGLYGESSRRWERELCRFTDRIICDSITIADDMKARYDRTARAIPQGVDLSAFNSDAAPDRRDEIARNLSQFARPIYGYIGGIHHSLDLDLLAEMARVFPKATLLLVGPISVSLHGISEPNLIFHGPVVYSDLAHYIRNFDVCMIPYKVNDFTAGVYPTKMLEYLACGKPIVSVDLPDIRTFSRYIYIAENRESFKKGLEQLGTGQLIPPSELVSHTWKARMDQLCEEITES